MRRLICWVNGHHHPAIANEVWNTTWQRWDKVAPGHYAVICTTCGRNLNGWDLRYRRVAA